ncbi:MAG: glycosyltransferase family 4 protein, partial [Elusimicrobia bacterium]|nr:glycosyltransferase family 4 protein [Elusimicrobiota bacterium]
MRIWLTQTGEPLPTDAGQARRFRTGLLAGALADRGHEVTWWASTFDHARKRSRCGESTVLQPRPGLTLELLHGRGYRRSISLARHLNHRSVAREFSLRAPRRTAPDIVFTSLPTLELSRAASLYASSRGIPVVLDVRDLWPDIFLDLAPRPAQGLSRRLLAPMFSSAEETCRLATALCAPSQGYLDWALAKAGRAQGSDDRVFPMAYPDTAPDEKARAAAEAFWDRLGVGRRGERFQACFFGAMTRHFDLETVIDAAAILRDAAPGYRFILCGSGGLLARHKARAARLPNVVFPGWVGAAEIWTLMRRCDAGLAPYRSTRGFVGHLPNKPVEYLSAGLPLVSSLEGTLRRLIEERGCGLHYPAGDPSSLAGGLRA